MGVVGDDVEFKRRHLVGRLVIPYLDRKGPRYVRYRCMIDHNHDEFGHGKYDGPAIDVPPMYNLPDLFIPSRYAAIVEGEFDTMIMSWQVRVPSTGLGGSHQWRVGARDTPDFRRVLFENYDKVFVIGDGDSAGDKMARLVAEDLPNGEVVRWDRNEDVNSIFVREGREGILHRLGLSNERSEEEEE